VRTEITIVRPRFSRAARAPLSRRRAQALHSQLGRLERTHTARAMTRAGRAQDGQYERARMAPVLGWVMYRRNALSQ
jgi:hypothetical protein